MRVRQVLAPALAVVALLAAPRSAAAQGAPFDFGCSSGYTLVGVQGWQGWWMDGVRGLCAVVDLDTGRRSGTVRVTGTAGTVTRNEGIYLCPDGTVLTGFTGNRATYVLSIHSLRCTGLQPGGYAKSGGTFRDAFPKRDAPVGQTSYFLAYDCSGGRVARRITGREGQYLDRFNITCDFIPGASAPVAAEPAPVRTPIRTTRPSVPARVTLRSPASGLQLRGHPQQPGCWDYDGFPAMTWNAVGDAARYEIRVRNVTQNKTRTGTSTTTSYGFGGRTPPFTVPTAGNSYTWEVRGVNALGQAGAWSEVRTIAAGAATRLTGTCVSSTAAPMPW